MIKLTQIQLLMNNILVILFILMTFSQNACSQETPDNNKSDSFHQVLIKIVDAEKAPGIIAAIISGEGIFEIVSAGERKVGSVIAFATDDQVHPGSCAKAMTSHMIATLVAEGKLNWESKLITEIL